MWGQIDGKAKIETAQETLSTLVAGLPTDTKLGLMAYGHRRDKDCGDVELLSDFGKNPPKMITTLIHTIKPMGKTPIANALKKSKDAFKGHEGQNNNILLVSDGIESCEGDPCAVAKELKDAGLNVSAHVIGFGVTKEEGKKLTCIADNTGGKYFDAANADAFNDAIKEVTQLAQVVPAPAPKAVSKVVFEDDFKGNALESHWEVKNPNPDRYIVDEGKLLLVMPWTASMSIENLEFPNLMQALETMPSGDWTIETVFNLDLQTSRDKFYIGVMDDQNNWIAAGIVGSEAYASCFVKVYIDKFEGGKHTVSDKIIVGNERNKGYTPCREGFKERGPMKLTLIKKGRDYSASVSFTYEDESVEVSPEAVKMLKPKSQLFMGLGQADTGVYGAKKAVESYLNIESIKVTAEE